MCRQQPSLQVAGQLLIDLSLGYTGGLNSCAPHVGQVAGGAFPACPAIQKVPLCCQVAPTLLRPPDSASALSGGPHSAVPS